MSLTLFLLIIASLVCSFFFAGIEIAFLSSNKLQLEVKAKQGSLYGRIISFFVRRPSWFIGTTLIGNTVGLVFYGNFMAEWLVPLLTSKLPHGLTGEPQIMIIHTFIATMLILFLAEYLPKSLFMINPNQILKILAVPFAVAFVLLSPLTFSIVFLSKFVIVNLFRLEYSEEKPAFGLTDLNNYMQDMKQLRHQNENIALDTTIFKNALRFKTVRVRNCMIPRTEMVAVAVDQGIEALTKKFIDSGLSKVIVYKQSIDDVIGYCHSSALFRKPVQIADIITPILSVPETTLANDLMVRFINEQKSLAVVIDEFGGTTGLVSMEDVIEEIFGEIEDEHDEASTGVVRINGNTFLLAARLEINHLNTAYGITLPEGDYETVGGLILSVSENLPLAGDIITVPPFQFKIENTRNNRIETVRLTILQEEQ